jgi:SSS family solute:Na+ symporter
MLFSIFNAPLFATFLLGMFTGWATPEGALAGLVCGTLASFGHWLLYQQGILKYGSDMTASFYGAGAGWLACFFITIAVSLVTKKSLRTVPLYRPPGLRAGAGSLPLPLLFSAAGILFALVVLNFIFA